MEHLTASGFITQSERQELLQKSDVKAFGGVLFILLVLTFAFGMVYFWLNPLTLILALFLIGGQQLAFAIIMHDAGHYSLFNDKGLNTFIGNWFGGYLIFQDVKKYREYHLIHHITTGTNEDPDLLLTRGYPTSRRSMIRKLLRDLTGQTGVKSLTGLIMMHLGYLKYNLGGKIERIDQSKRSWSKFLYRFFKDLGGPLTAQFIVFLILTFTIGPLYYLLWIGAYLTTFQLSIRIRSMAEHAMTDNDDPIRNTRTTYANWIEKLLFAPLNVNYHLEHHMLMGVPYYNLPRMHKLLLERGFYEKGILAKGYSHIVRQAIVNLAPGSQ